MNKKLVRTSLTTQKEMFSITWSKDTMDNLINNLVAFELHTSCIIDFYDTLPTRLKSVELDVESSPLRIEFEQRLLDIKIIEAYNKYFGDKIFQDTKLTTGVTYHYLKELYADSIALETEKGLSKNAKELNLRTVRLIKMEYEASIFFCNLIGVYVNKRK